MKNEYRTRLDLRKSFCYPVYTPEYKKKGKITLSKRGYFCYLSEMAYVLLYRVFQCFKFSVKAIVLTSIYRVIRKL